MKTGAMMSSETMETVENCLEMKGKAPYLQGWNGPDDIKGGRQSILQTDAHTWCGKQDLNLHES